MVAGNVRTVRKKLTMRMPIIIFCTISLIGASILAFSVYASSSGIIAGSIPLISSSSPRVYNFGSDERGFTGWLMPANTDISTSYVTSQNASNFVTAILNVFPYQIEQNTSLRVGLYVNGALAATQSYELSQGHARPATSLATIESLPNDHVDNFSMSLEGYTVTLFLNGKTLPSGTTITVVALTNTPIWAQIDNNPARHSYESSVISSFGPLPTTVKSGGGSVAPQAISVGLESNAA